MTTISQYRNGNYQVTLFDDGTKIRETNDAIFRPDFPEQADCKITNWCNNPICAEFCHEQSNKQGSHGDLIFALDILKTWNAGVEVAIGGGSTLSHPEILPFLHGLKNQGKIANLTVNHFHVKSQATLIEEIVSNNLAYGIGVSYMPALSLQSIKDVFKKNKNLVFHLILGVHTIEDVKYLCANFENPKVLFLGYKQFGNGISYKEKHNTTVEKKLYGWFTRLHELFDVKGLITSYDNLAIEQMKLRRFFTPANWQKFYQGDEGTCSFYMDFVKQEYGLSSTAKTRQKMAKGMTVRQMWQNLP